MYFQSILSPNIEWCIYMVNVFVVRQPNSNLGHLTVDDSRPHTHTRARTHTVGLLWTVIISSQRPLPTQHTNIHALSGVRTRDPSDRAATLSLILIKYNLQLNLTCVLQYESQHIKLHFIVVLWTFVTCIYVVCMVFRTNNDYFPVRLVSMTETECLLHGTNWLWTCVRPKR